MQDISKPLRWIKRHLYYINLSFKKRKLTILYYSSKRVILHPEDKFILRVLFYPYVTEFFDLKNYSG